MSLPNNPRAKCWGWFKLIPGDAKNVECAFKSCKEHIPYVEGDTTSTRKMNEHVKKIHNLDTEKDSPPIPSSTPTLQSMWNGKQPTSLTDSEKMENIAKFFAVHSIPRSIFGSPTYQSAHSESIPAGMHRVKNLESAMDTLYKKQCQELTGELIDRLSTMETDAWKSFSKEWVSFIINGRFWKTIQQKDREFKNIVIKMLEDNIELLQKETGTILIAAVSDNCNKITLPLFEVCSKKGILCLRCSPHSMNLVLQDLWNEDPDLTSLNKKIVAITRMLMSNKKYAEVFYKHQLDWIATFPIGKRPNVRKLLKAAAARWSSRSTCWERFLELAGVIQKTLSDLKLTWKNVAEYVENATKMLREDILDAKTRRNLETEAVKEKEEISKMFELEDDEDDEEELTPVDPSNKGYLELSTQEIDLIHNLYHGVIRQQNAWVLTMQNQNFSLFELSVLWKKIKEHCIDVEKWNEHIHAPLKKEVDPDGNKQEIQGIWLNFATLLQSRSFQFNDLSISLIEHFDPKFKGVYSFENHSEEAKNLLDFEQEGSTATTSASSQSPSDSEKSNQDLHSIGVLLTHRILSLRDGLKLELSDVRKQLRVEYMHYMSKTYVRPKDFDKCTLQEFWKYQTCFPDIKANEEKSTNAMPYLATFVLAIMGATAANVGVERSFKCQKFVLTAERNRLSEYKTNQEMMIRFNHFSDSREEKSRERIGNVLKKGFKSKYSEQEIQAIDAKIDEKEEKRVEEKKKKKTHPKKSQPPSTHKASETEKKSKKYKNLDSLGKRQSTFDLVPRPKIQDDDETDDDYNEVPDEPPKKKKKKDKAPVEVAATEEEEE